MAIFHDRFSDLRDELRELLITSPVRHIYCVNIINIFIHICTHKIYIYFFFVQEDRQETMEDKVRHMVDEEVGVSQF